MQRRFRMGHLLAGLCLLLAFGGQRSPAAAQAGFADPAFQRVWERTDKPVADKKADRSWYWGKEPGFALMEPSKDSPGGERLVQYFDKSRMEINDPNGDPTSPFYVTTGLLALELMTGRIQIGSNDFEQHCVATIPLASDTDDANAPTYATFGALMNQPKSNQVGQKATAVIDKDGNVSADASKAAITGVEVAYFEPATGRNVPKVFWDFLNAQDTIYTGSQFTTDKINDPWYYASGLPVTDAYWANVKIDGRQTDVLIQAFERRILTYSPDDNDTSFSVQMGNVGQHYYAWRYKGQGCGAGTPGQPGGGAEPGPTTPPVACDEDVPPAVNGTVTPRCGPVGTVFQIHITGFLPDEKVSLWLSDPTGRAIGPSMPLDFGHHGSDLDDFFDSSLFSGFGDEVQGIWALTYQGETSGNQAIAWFRLLPEPEPSPTATPPPDATPSPVPACDTTGQKDASVSPGSGAEGTVFDITITGFQPDEQASFWLTDPDGAVFGSPRNLIIPEGGGDTLPFPSDGLYPGRWALTIHGLTSNHESIGVFCITP